MPALDWSLLQAFVAVVEAGSLASAARKTGSSQPTMSRHMAILESAL
ncbi:MAG: LysR family transcriptional regulator, partial [Phenylobacterium sp.]|nr:LysR family transcriptional regulator [Phenylobacterium sp.]